MQEIRRTPAAEAFSRLIVETFRFNGALMAAGDRLTKELGLTSALWQVLGSIVDEPLPLAQIARNMGLTRQSVRRSAGVLEDRGFLEFQENPNHRRAKLATITEHGKKAINSIHTLQANWANAAAEGFSEEELYAAVRVMETLGERIK